LSKTKTKPFSFKSDDLTSCFRLALKNIIKYGDTDIFPFPYETRMFEDMEEEMLVSLDDTFANFEKRRDVAPPLNVSSCSTVGYTGYRWATQIDPYWNAFFLGIVLRLSQKIEEDRLPEDVIYSYRFQPDNTDYSLFKKDVNWRKYQLDSLELCEKNEDINYILTCDIADFYPRIYHHRLENALDRLDEHKNYSSKIKKLLQVFSGTNSYGVPVGCPASRILAELALSSIDHILSVHGFIFKRYVDDFYIFCKTKESAHSALTFLSRKFMENEGLTLQKHKTNIMSKEEFITLTKSKVNGIDEDEHSPLKASFMALPIRYDPYSANANERYNEIKNSLKDFDLLGMLSDELQKSRINQPFSRQLVRSFAALDDNKLSSAYNVICESFNDLYPIFTTIMQVATSNWERFDKPTKEYISDTINQLIKNDSFILKTELNLAYVCKLLSRHNTQTNQILLTEIYNNNINSILITNIITQAMLKWNAHFWLSDLKRAFPTMNALQRRIFIISTYALGDEGEHWRNHNKRNFTFIETIYKDWGAKRKAAKNIGDAL
jgi:hypothetical protein